LDFIRKDWRPLQELNKESNSNYEFLFSKSNNSLYSIRNSVAHEEINISHEDYKKLLDVAKWAINNLSMKIPKINQLRERKRRSDAQLRK
jgi:hypothetical protein